MSRTSTEGWQFSLSTGKNSGNKKNEKEFLMPEPLLITESSYEEGKQQSLLKSLWSHLSPKALKMWNILIPSRNIQVIHHTGSRAQLSRVPDANYKRNKNRCLQSLTLSALNPCAPTPFFQ